MIKKSKTKGESRLKHGFSEAVLYFLTELLLGGRSAPDPPPISSPKKSSNNSSSNSFIKICILCTPTYQFPPVMRIPVQNPIGSGTRPAYGLLSRVQGASSMGYTESDSNELGRRPGKNLASLLFIGVSYQGAWVVATPHGVWHRDSHYWRKFIGGGTQDTDVNKGIVKICFTEFLRRRNWGVRGTPTP